MRHVLPVLLTLAACNSIYQTRTYAGRQTPLAGICNPPSQASLTQRGSQFILAPGDGTLTLEGPAAGDILHLEATLIGADRLPYRLVFQGQLAKAEIVGTLTTPRCRYALAFKRTGD